MHENLQYNTTTTTILPPLYWLSCVSPAPQLRTRWFFVGAKFYWPHPCWR